MTCHINKSNIGHIASGERLMKYMQKNLSVYPKTTPGWKKREKKEERLYYKAFCVTRKCKNLVVVFYLGNFLMLHSHFGLKFLGQLSDFIELFFFYSNGLIENV